MIKFKLQIRTVKHTEVT